MKTFLIPILFALVAGAVLPLQAVFNIQLGKPVNQPIFAVFASFVIGSVVLFFYLLVLKFDFSMATQVKSASFDSWLGGVLGAFYVAVVVILTPKLGTALTFGLVVAGQMVFSLILDHYGLYGLPIRQVNWPRIIGILLLLVGVIIIQKY